MYFSKVGSFAESSRHIFQHLVDSFKLWRYSFLKSTPRKNDFGVDQLDLYKPVYPFAGHKKFTNRMIFCLIFPLL